MAELLQYEEESESSYDGSIEENSDHNCTLIKNASCLKRKMRKDVHGCRELDSISNGSSIREECIPKVKQKRLSTESDRENETPGIIGFSETDGPSIASLSNSSSIRGLCSSPISTVSIRQDNCLQPVPIHVQRTRSWLKSVKKKLIAMVCCYLLGFFSNYILITLSSSFYNGRALAKMKIHSEDSTIALEGDYVELFYTINKPSLNIYDYSLQFMIVPPTNGSLITAAIYNVPCDLLLATTSKTEQFTNSLADSATSTIPSPTKQYFDSCSKYNTGICILDQYVYQAKSRVSVIIYRITLDSYVSGETLIWILAYDNVNDFQQFLNGSSPSKAVKKVRVNENNFLFVLNNEEMKRSAYYFFAVQKINGSSQWFTVDRIGYHVYYNASKLSPNCTIKNTSKYSCQIQATSNQCLLGRVHGNVSNSSDPLSDCLYHINGVMTYATAIDDALIVFGSVIFLIVMAILFHFCGGYCLRSFREELDLVAKV